MALSLESAALVWVLCNTLKPKSIVDLGSGFSSYVIRRWAKEHSTETIVWSVDDDRPWLDRSSEFCAKHDVSTENFAHWDAFKEIEQRFDFVIYDLGRMPCRSTNLKTGLQLVTPSGIVLVDDMHKFNYNKEVVKALSELGLNSRSMKEFTIDPHEGRHCWLASPPGSFELGTLFA